MVERKHISLIYQYNDNWIGGTYYILNIIKSLDRLNEQVKPFLTIIYDDEKSLHDIKILNYPYISYRYKNLKFNFLERIINKIFWITHGNVLIKKSLHGGSIENLYPVSIYINIFNISNYYYWIPDFQERHLPKFFSKKKIKDRVKIQILIKNSGKPIVFSSENALNDYNEIYPHNSNKKNILKFVSVINDDFKDISIEYLKEKFKIKKLYFLVPNQFWQHKNQFIVIKAAKILKEQDVDFQIIFTGKEYDNRHPEYIINLKKYVTENNLEDVILFLGFIDRREQLQLMKNSVAVIQPSLFEGWSTVVEDTKAIEHFIILSDIPLHREQITENCLFFDPYNEHDLFNKIMDLLNSKVKIVKVDYQNAILKFAENFLNIF